MHTVFIDFDDVVWDVFSFILALCRAATHRKITPNESTSTLHAVAYAQLLLADEEAVVESSHAAVDDASKLSCPLPEDWRANFDKLLELNKELVKPKIGCSVVLEELLKLKDTKIVLVSFCELRIDQSAGSILQSCRPVPTATGISGNPRYAGAAFCELSSEALDHNSAGGSFATKWCSVPPIDGTAAACANTVLLTARRAFTQLFAKHGITRTLKYDSGNPLQSIASIVCTETIESNLTPKAKCSETQYQFRVQPTKIVPQRSVLEDTEKSCWRVVRFLENRIFVEGTVVAGFSRGSSQLGIPTANLNSIRAVDQCSGADVAINSLVPGVYFGWATFLSHSDASLEHLVTSAMKYGMVMSVGYNPYYKNTTLTIEPHLFEYEGPAFNGSILKLEIAAFGRVEADFANFGQLVRAIQNDCEVAKENI